uniref:Uncharacterized protein n=1 Tax=Glossina pallidipes TaxID=7398 RepID=A0A1A9ZJF4_GLOPL
MEQVFCLNFTASNKNLIFGKTLAISYVKAHKTWLTEVGYQLVLGGSDILSSRLTCQYLPQHTILRQLFVVYSPPVKNLRPRNLLYEVIPLIEKDLWDVIQCTRFSLFKYDPAREEYPLYQSFSAVLVATSTTDFGFKMCKAAAMRVCVHVDQFGPCMLGHVCSDVMVLNFTPKY